MSNTKPCYSREEFISTTRSQIDQAFTQPESSLSHYLAENFPKLVDPNVDTVFRWCFLESLLARFAVARRMASTKEGPNDTFVQTCIQAGMAGPLVTLAKEKTGLVTPETWNEESFPRLMPPFQAMNLLEAVVPSIRLIEQRGTAIHDLIKHGVLDVVFCNMNARLLIRRLTATRMLASLSERTLIPRKVPPSTTAKLLCVLFTAALRDPALDSEQLNDETTLWQSWFEDDFRDSRNNKELGDWYLSARSRRWMVSRLCGRIQRYAMEAAHRLIAIPPPSLSKLWIEVLECRPEITSLLLECTMLERPEYYPETHIGLDSVEALSALFRWPSYWIPGISVPTDRPYLSQDLKLTLRLFSILISHKGWVEKIIDIWETHDADNESVITR
ncbi:hypothetical protein CONPUDRAFT_78100 [Coniophora puteana RWD-64-598 SS2]|uniref:Uncharacterized protein n=1 Tax=Coniophora puteana (strain RWD-64-598) TaxID=741705 RepID=R7SFD5_CONPW|nr:uncharacterized protein CONPUDRAFT_78100 [Coniophora puteana RWD-64-598 SS2]EIW74457.1 hypothetical protein CONPUDRAFT_78100 [Coniophora puteana RWD-64-598 SS2]